MEQIYQKPEARINLLALVVRVSISCDCIMLTPSHPGVELYVDKVLAFLKHHGQTKSDAKGGQPSLVLVTRRTQYAV